MNVPVGHKGMVRGVWYVAKPALSKENHCAGCAFREDSDGCEKSYAGIGGCGDVGNPKSVVFVEDTEAGTAAYFAARMGI